MAMVIELKATAGGTLQTLGTVEIQRQEPLENPEWPYDEMHTYTVKQFRGWGAHQQGETVTVEHRYGDGAWTLAQKALEALPVRDRMPQS